MRTARLVGLSPDGESVLVLSDQGEEFAVAADDRLRAVVCGDRLRFGPREAQMETALSPREIQTRIRSGASVHDVSQLSGMPAERVERFATPVLAEREYVAATAGSSSARRRGETSGHRTLRTTVHEHLRGRDIDLDTVVWDASRREDGRWQVTVDFDTGPEVQRAGFVYDPQGRFSVADDDQARTLLGETPARRADPLSAADESGTEATVELDDELALVRAIQEPPPAADGLLGGDGSPSEAPADVSAEAAEPTVAVLRRVVTTDITQVSERGDAVSDGPASEDSIRVYAGLSDASAVPEVDAGGFDPTTPALDFPVEPGPEEDADDAEGHGPIPGRELDDEPDALIPGPAPTVKPGRRKRASVPSWDEIMFGGPKRG